MALVPSPINMNVVRAMRGIIDFYYWKGLGVARKWPRRAQQPNSVRQLAARAQMTQMHAILKSLPKAWHDFWKTVLLPSGRSVEDLKRKHVLWLLHNARWSEPPVIKSTTYQALSGAPTAQLYIIHQPFADPTAAALVCWLVRYWPTTPGNFEYEDFAPAKTREHYYYWQTRPIVADYVLPIAQAYSSAALTWTLTIRNLGQAVSVMARPFVTV